MLNKNDTRSMLLHDSPQSLVLKLSYLRLSAWWLLGFTILWMEFMSDKW